MYLKPVLACNQLRTPAKPQILKCLYLLCWYYTNVVFIFAHHNDKLDIKYQDYIKASNPLLCDKTIWMCTCPRIFHNFSWFVTLKYIRLALFFSKLRLRCHWQAKRHHIRETLRVFSKGLNKSHVIHLMRYMDVQQHGC